MHQPGTQSGLSLLELTLALSIGMVILAGTLYQVRQVNVETRIQSSKTMLNLVRSELATYRYRNGRYPSGLSEFDAMPSPPGIPRNRWLIEPISGSSASALARNGNGGWVYTPGINATVSVNLFTQSAGTGGEDPAGW